MRKVIFTLLVFLMGSWISANARWELVNEDGSYDYPSATNYKQLVPGKYVILRTGSAQDQTIWNFTYLMGENMSFVDDDLMLFRSENVVYFLEDAGVNEMTGCQMVYFKNVGTGKYIGASGAGSNPYLAGATPTFVDGTEDAYRILLIPADGDAPEISCAADYKSGTVEESGYTDPDGTPLVHAWGYDEENNCTGTMLAIDPSSEAGGLCILNNFGTTGTTLQCVAQTWGAWKPWLIYEVKTISDPVYDLQWGVEEYSEMTAEGYALPDGYVSYDPEAVDAYNSALMAAREAQLNENLTAEEATALLNRLKETKEAALATAQGGLTSGYYYLVSASSVLGDTKVAMTVNSDNSALAYTKFNADDVKQIFEIGPRNGQGAQDPNDWYNINYLKNVATGKYVGTTANLTEDAVTFAMYALGSNNGAWRGEGVNQWDFIESSGWSGGIGLQNLENIDEIGSETDEIERTVACPADGSWNHTIGGNCAFYLVAIDPSIDVDKLIEDAKKAQLVENFNKALAEAKELYNAGIESATTEDQKAIYADLLAAITAAEAVETPTQTELDAINVALLDFKNSTGVAAKVFEAIDEANEFIAGAQIAESYDDYGKYTEEAISTLFGVIENIDVEALGEMSNSALENLITEVKNALATAKASMIVPFTTDKWYVMENVSSPNSEVWPAGGTYDTKGAFLYANGGTAGSTISWGMPENARLYGDPRTYWRFVPTDGGYAIQNASGLYVDNSCQASGLGATWTLSEEPSAFDFNISTFDDDDNQYFTFQTRVAGADWQGTMQLGMLHADASGSVVGWDHGNSRIGSAWQFKAVEDFDELLPAALEQEYVNNTYNVVTMPYAYSMLPSGVTMYSIIGRNVGDDKSTTKLFMKEVSEDELVEMPAGTPLIMLIGDPALPYNSEDKVVVNMSLSIDNIDGFVTLSEGKNGLTGTMFSPVAVSAGNDNFVGGAINSAAVTVPAYSGYIVPANVPVMEDGFEDNGVYDAVIVTEGLVDKITNVISAEDVLVNVYSYDGLIVRKNVKASEATRNLPSGIYIVGKKKVLVK